MPLHHGTLCRRRRRFAIEVGMCLNWIELMMEKFGPLAGPSFFSVSC